MIAYIARRILLAVFAMWVISILSWVIIQLPEGDAIDTYFSALEAGDAQGHNEERMEAMRRYLGLDKPMMVRYVTWMWRMVHGDLGRSFLGTTGSWAEEEAVKRLIGDRLWLTVVLTGFTIIVTWTFAIPIGIYSGVRQHSVGDYTFTLLGFAGLAVPDFLLAWC